MSQKAAIVTGASSGIGLAIAEMLANEGFGLTLVARRPEKLEAAAQPLIDAGHKIEVLALSIQNDEAPGQVLAAHEARFGRLDVLINNAGVGVASPVGTIQDKHLDMQMGVNLRAPIRLLRESVPLLTAAAKENGSALVVNTASITGRYAEAGLGVYSATKSALIGFNESAHLELSHQGIKCVAICPGVVDTPMVDFVRDSMPEESMIRPSDIAESVRFMLNLSPSCFIPEIQFVRAGHRNM